MLANLAGFFLAAASGLATDRADLGGKRGACDGADTDGTFVTDLSRGPDCAVTVTLQYPGPPNDELLRLYALSISIIDFITYPTT